MANITVFAVDAPVVIYLQDGSSYSIGPQAEHHFQLIDGGFCTISDTASDDDAEHPPPGYAFINAMIEFWQACAAKIKAEAPGGPTATPV